MKLEMYSVFEYRLKKKNVVPRMSLNEETDMQLKEDNEKTWSEPRANTGASLLALSVQSTNTDI
jgi:hypothetical protein